jgi:hypothetical protein
VIIMESETKYIAKVGNMWITAVFETAEKVSLSRNVGEACDVKECWRWLESMLGAIVYSASTTYKQISK